MRGLYGINDEHVTALNSIYQTWVNFPFILDNFESKNKGGGAFYGREALNNITQIRAWIHRFVRASICALVRAWICAIVHACVSLGRRNLAWRVGVWSSK